MHIEGLTKGEPGSPQQVLVRVLLVVALLLLVVVVVFNWIVMEATAKRSTRNQRDRGQDSLELCDVYTGTQYELLRKRRIWYISPER